MGGTRSLFVLAAFAAMVITTAVPADAAGLLVPRDGSPPIAVKSHRVTVTVTDGLAATGTGVRNSLPGTGGSTARAGSMGASIVTPARLTEFVHISPSQYRPSPIPLGSRYQPGNGLFAGMTLLVSCHRSERGHHIRLLVPAWAWSRRSRAKRLEDDPVSCHQHRADDGNPEGEDPFQHDARDRSGAGRRGADGDDWPGRTRINSLCGVGGDAPGRRGPRQR
jgi:hypothetical protein